jgi:DNA replication and repair protein RecF
MAREGVAVAAIRRDVTVRLDQAASDGVGSFPVPRLAIVGTAEAWLAEMPALAAEDRLRAGFAQSRRLDAETGGAAVGPHRSDFAVRHAAKNMPAERCSTGEQKALLLAILLSHARLQAALKGTAPVMLLDEVAAHLDRPRRAALYEELLALGGQAWLTGTDRALFAELGGRAQFFNVADAMITAAADA